MAKILVGTASWTDKSLIASGRFYPTKCNAPEDRLRYYSSQFPLVEVDSSYYAIPAPRVAQLWAERTPADFTFNIKAFRLLTGHQTAPAALPKDIAEALGPIGTKNLYYKDMPSELRDELWRASIVPESIRSGTRANWGLCISSLRHGWRTTRETLNTLRNASVNWMACCSKTHPDVQGSTRFAVTVDVVKISSQHSSRWLPRRLFCNSC